MQILKNEIKEESGTPTQTESGHPELDGDLVDTTELNRFIKATEKWRDYMFATGYELNQYQQMVTICEDNTIKVRRLVRNFKD